MTTPSVPGAPEPLDEAIQDDGGELPAPDLTEPDNTLDEEDDDTSDMGEDD